MTVKERLRDLIEEMPEHRALQVERYIEALEEVDDPLMAALEAAPEDDEPLDEEDLAAIAAAEAELARGEALSWVEVRTRVGRAD